jgi:DNA-binding IclR family transcriptional regulator
VARPSPQTDRVVTLLQALATNPGAGMTVAEIARRLGVNKATCYPMLVALQESGWLVRHPARRTFHLGPALVPLGRAAAVGLPTAELVHATLDGLAHDLGVSAVAIAPAEEHVVVVDVATPSVTHAPSLRPGQRIPLRPPWGAVFVAWGPDAALERWLAHASETDAERWRTVLASVRELGAVVELDELFRQRERERVELASPMTDRAALQSMVEQLSQQPQPVLTDLAGDQSLPVVSINAPVRGAGGEVTLAVAAMGFPRLLPGTEIRAVVERVRVAASSLD